MTNDYDDATVPRLYRAGFADLEIRGDGRTIVGLAVPFDTPADIADAQGVYQETFRQGAFARTIAHRGDRVKALALHDRRRLPLGRAHSLREDSNGLTAELHISQTREGDEALELVRDGALDGLSIGFRPTEGGDRWNATRTAVERLEVRLDEISLVAFPAYDDARISAVRFTTAGPQFDRSPAISVSTGSPARPETDGAPDEGDLTRLAGRGRRTARRATEAAARLRLEG